MFNRNVRDRANISEQEQETYITDSISSEQKIDILWKDYNKRENNKIIEYCIPKHTEISVSYLKKEPIGEIENEQFPMARLKILGKYSAELENYLTENSIPIVFMDDVTVKQPEDCCVM